MSDPTQMTLTQLADLLANRQISAMDLLDAYNHRIERFDPVLNAFRSVDIESAKVAAKACDARKHRFSPLDGLPFAVKENIDIAGSITGSGLAPRDERVADQDSAVIHAMRRAGAVILGHTSMHEGALGATNDNPHYGRTHNPWRIGFTPGGSSGGSAAAVGAGFCPLALGTDTMGSVRLPAAYCGLAGYKPSQATIDNAGIEPLHPAFDQVGAIARCVADLRLWFEAITTDRCRSNIDPRSLRWGYPRDLDNISLEDDVRNAVDDVLCLVERDVFVLEPHDVALGFDLGNARRAGLLLIESSAAEHFREDRERFPTAFSDDFATLLDYGANADQARLAKAEAIVADAKKRIDVLFSDVDVIIMPTTPQTAFSFDGPVPANQADLTAPANFAGAPAVTLPIAIGGEGLPIGLQVMGRHGSDAMVLAAASAIEDALDFTLPKLPRGERT